MEKNEKLGIHLMLISIAIMLVMPDEDPTFLVLLGWAASGYIFATGSLRLWGR